ncbi:Sucrose-6-phosphate hydrolase [bioreactor metagenome]|uniref:beta-fructofuranosidase n=1 Tax=bioreactor metagenome TaxID=1076179 RepID=A0A644XN95_9ZZZZ
MYRSADAVEWELLGEVDAGLPDFGFMWECPDLFEIDGKTVLLFSPQGLEPEGDRYHNIYQTGYVIADDFRMDELKLAHDGFQELDAGFDFYATQTAESPDGRRILTAWMGLPEIEYPTDSEDWAHCLTLPRELSLKDGKLMQQPVRELVALRKTKTVSDAGLLSETKRFGRDGANCYELQLELTFPASADQAPVTLDLCEDAANDKRFRITLDPSAKKITIDRSRCGIPFAEDFGTTRSLAVEQMEKVKLQIFVDISSIEIFVNDGEATFTSRVFPEAGETGLSLAAGSTIDYSLDLWELA